ncbi:hypothetical protein [Isobaculum melis]|uniref:Uncharacterized protein n=1 Tax=Isobaculum melis TaxID=142588 RepID=A0A1H9U9X3_9LACT|nr:hypothetical protein [Isobaculum melis]SES06038.1 hypothetical protein SAMN04488559_12420 [Isobaculum melis]
MNEFYLKHLIGMLVALIPIILVFTLFKAGDERNEFIKKNKQQNQHERIHAGLVD